MSLSPKPIAQTDPPHELLPSHIAAGRNDVQELSRLLSSNEETLDPQSKETPLHAAARTGSVGALKWLLENNIASPTAKAANGNTAAHYAAVFGHSDALQLLLTYDPTMSDQIVVQTDENGLSILSLATLQGDEEMAKWILDNFASVVDIQNPNGNLAVHFAAAQGQLPILKLLVKKCGKDIAEKSDTRQTKPVFFASQEGKLDVLDYLVNELGVDAVGRDKAGMSSVHAATQGGQTNTVKWLISKLGTKYVLDKTVDGATPLHMAAALGHMEILKFFLDSLEDKESINVQDHIRATPAHDAAEYGQTQAMLLLLKYGADITVKDSENKTPHELALEQSHSEVAAMIADYRDNGASVLSKYEQKKSRRQRYDTSDKSRPHTNRQVADELSTVIDQTTAVVEQRKEKELQRQESLQKMNEVGRDDDEESTEPKHRKKKISGSHRHQHSYDNDSDEDIEHALGPKGDLYARPKKRRHHGHSSHQNGDIDDFISETMSHRSYTSGRHHPPGFLPVDDAPYATVNHETASNYSRPSRVKRYHDSDSELSFPGSAGQHYSDGRHNIPGFYPPYNSMYPPQVPPPRSHVSSRHSSHGSRSHHQGYMMAPPPIPMAYPAPYGYGMPTAMMPGYYGPYPGYPMQYGAHPGYGGRPKTTEERMHMAALQQQQPAPAHMIPGYGGHPQHYLQQGRRSALLKDKKAGSKPPPTKEHTDQDIGYGPSISSAVAQNVDDHFHPPAPPVTHKDGTVEDTDMVKFDSNFIMLKKSETGEVRQVGGTTLNPAKATHAAYDGRYDQYIMTDSEEEHEIDEQHSVGYAAEMAAILAIGCVAGLRGLTRMRKKGAVVEAKSDKPHLASAWETVPTDMGKRGSRRGSLSGIEDPALKGMSEEDYANQEEWKDKNAWEKKGKGKQKKTAESAGVSTDVTEKPQSELLTAELHKQSYESVSKSFGQKILMDALGARESSMLNIAAASGFGSRMSLNQTSDEDDDDDFGDAISMVHGMIPGEGRGKVSAAEKKARRTKEEEVDTLAQVTTTTIEDEKAVITEDKKKSKKEKKVKKKEKKEKKSKESKHEKPTEDTKAQKKQAEAEQQQNKSAKKASKKDKGKNRKLTVKPSPPQAQRETEVTLKSQEASKPAGQSSHRSNNMAAAPPPKEVALKTKEEASRQVEKQHTVSVSVAVNETSSASKVKETSRASKSTEKSSGPRDVKNPAFPDSDDESPRRRSKVSSSKYDAAAASTTTSAETQGKPITSTTKKPQKSPPTPIKMTEADKEIFGEEGFDELNDVLRQLDDMQAGLFTTVPNPVAAISKDVVKVPTPQKSASASVSSVDSQSDAAYELQETEKTEWIESRQYGSSASQEQQWVQANHNTTQSMATSNRGYSFDGNSGSGAIVPSINGDRTAVAQQAPATHTLQQQETLMSATEANTQSMQTAAYSNTFESNVLNTLAALNETMQQMKSNPSVTQTEIIQQQRIQQTLIQNLLSSSQNDPSLTSKLLAMLETTAEENAKSASIPLGDLEHKLLNAQERQMQEAKEHFRTQSAFQQSIERKLEEQAQQQMQGIQANFERYTKLLEEQLAEQRKRWEEELQERGAKQKSDKKGDKNRNRKKGRKHKHRKRHSSDSENSSSSSSDDGLLQPKAKTVAYRPEVKTMQAKIFSQDLLEEAAFESPSTAKKGNITGKGHLLKRRDTQYEFGKTADAFSKFEGEDNIEEDADELQYQHAKPITLKRADIKFQENNEYTPKRVVSTSVTTTESSNGVQVAKREANSTSSSFHMLKQKTIKFLDEDEPSEEYDESKLKFGHHVSPNPKKEFDRSNTAGAGSELAAVLRLRNKRAET